MISALLGRYLPPLLSHVQYIAKLCPTRREPLPRNGRHAGDGKRAFFFLLFSPSPSHRTYTSHAPPLLTLPHPSSSPVIPCHPPFSNRAAMDIALLLSPTPTATAPLLPSSPVSSCLPPARLQPPPLSLAPSLAPVSPPDSSPPVAATPTAVVKPFPCPRDGCGASFGQKGSLTRHLKNRHTPSSRTHNCPHPDCEKSFSEKWTLSVHRRNVHLKLKTHCCIHCGKKFGEKWNLRKHINVVHLRVKPFVCPLCARAFGYKGDMSKHVAELHEGDILERPFVCSAQGCGVRFARLRYLRRHQNLTHGIGKREGERLAPPAHQGNDGNLALFAHVATSGDQS